jgi:hypothetical protein
MQTQTNSAPQPSLKIKAYRARKIPCSNIIRMRYNHVMPSVMCTSHGGIRRILYRRLVWLDNLSQEASDANRQELACYFNGWAYNLVEMQLEVFKRRVYAPASIRNAVRMQLKVLWKQSSLIDCDLDIYKEYFPDHKCMTA